MMWRILLSVLMQEFKKIEQEENEKINEFESRVRSKAQKC